MQSQPRTHQQGERFTAEHVERWRNDGGVSIPRFFTDDEVAAVCADFERVFGRDEVEDSSVAGDTASKQRQADPLNKKKPGEIGRFNGAQFKEIAPVPIDCSPALNLIGVHPSLIAFAKAALDCEKVHVYQCQAWAKFTGDADYDQPFHCDFANHTLTVPSEDAHLNSVTILCYFSDVTEAHGPMHYVTRPDSLKVGGPEASLQMDPSMQRQLQDGLRAFERSSAAPAGSVFPYSIDVFHRGTNLTAPFGHRYALMTCFKRAQDDSIGFHAWAFHHQQPWRHIFEHATPAQLECFGVQPPGHKFWTETTLRRAAARYPAWDLTPYRAACNAARASSPTPTADDAQFSDERTFVDETQLFDE